MEITLYVLYTNFMYPCCFYAIRYYIISFMHDVTFHKIKIGYDTKHKMLLRRQYYYRSVAISRRTLHECCTSHLPKISFLIKYYHLRLKEALKVFFFFFSLPLPVLSLKMLE